MNKKTLIFAILFIISGFFYYNFTGSVVKETYEAKVIRVVDGDTIELDNGQKVRLRGINTPEKSMSFYKDATNFLEELILNETVEVKSYGVDKYGRTLAHVFFNDENINELVIKNGFGTLYYYEEDEYYNNLKNAEEFARLNGAGIWKKSLNYGCLELIMLKYEEEPKRCSNDEILEIKNLCDKNIEFIIKDDATHIYKEKLGANSILEKNFSCIWNDDGDSIYAWDKEGLLMFYRY